MEGGWAARRRRDNRCVVRTRDRDNNRLRIADRIRGATVVRNRIAEGNIPRLVKT